MADTTARPTITLYTAATPNGIKISIALEVLGLPYKTHHLDLSTNAQKEPWFLDINPNGRIPVITDTLSDGSPIRVFESGSILLYLAERYDTELKVSYQSGSPEYFETISWLFWQNAGLGPMQGQANHFRRYAPEKEQQGYSLNRYQAETRRLYGVLGAHLGRKKSPFLVGDKATIADFSVLSWTLFADWAGVDIDEFPLVKSWEERVCAIPGVINGTEVPKPTLDLRHMSARQKEEYARKASRWIVQDAGKQ
ncbi:glutathione S-transferase [Cladophialophora psammophila CBS 110553]|uniref:Glutathione S-transferase n=1 Tax=Cladophialophora psammophila CBS 110553 TaxID=1182543 RepID=W9WU81_9EURO|nr:glutathione S-transferase [Cladophialophora psammophila CBS 110553]EXJ71767.1 glutathione S-transferase [Cladophialophora psammophila CBS 110553]